MDIDNLTYGELKQIAALFNQASNGAAPESGSLNRMLGQKVIVRTYSAGCWFGELSEKSGNEVIVKNARRMYRWWAAESISLSAVALHGLKHDKSKIVEAVPSIWLEAVEIIPCSDKAISSLEGAQNVKAE